MTEDSVDTFRLSDIERKCFCTFSRHFVMVTRFVKQLGAFDALWEIPGSILKNHDVLETLFLDFVTCFKKHKSTSARW